MAKTRRPFSRSPMYIGGRRVAFEPLHPLELQLEELRRLQRDERLPKKRKRHAHKSEPAMVVLRHLYPPDGRRSRLAVPDAALEREYHEECDRRGIHKNDRIKRTQLLRLVGRKK